MSHTGRILSGMAAAMPAVNLTAMQTAPICITSTNKKTLCLETLNPNIIQLQYAVRGPLVIRAAELKNELQKVLFHICAALDLELEVIFFWQS